MAQSDLAAIDTVIYTTLNGDSTLRGFATDGVFWDVAPSTSKFVLLSRSDGEHMNALADRDGWDRVTYSAKAVIASSSVVQADSAAFRIHELLHHALADVVAGNYRIMHIDRTLPIRYMELDPQNTAARWQHRGGQYEVMVCPATDD